MKNISVVMVAYNAAKFIREAIDSVLNQTYEDFEFIIVDDGSTDNTIEIIKSYKDKRICFWTCPHNYINSLNTGFRIAEGNYIARIDADDIMHRERLRIQHQIMLEDPSIDVCGSWIIPFGDHASQGGVCGTLDGYVDFPLIELLRGNILYHPTVMIKREFLQKYNLQYLTSYPYAEDYKLWEDIAALGGRFYVESYPLVFYRMTDDQVSRKYKQEQNESAYRIKEEVLRILLDRLQDRFVIRKFQDCFQMLLNEGYVKKSYYWKVIYEIMNHNRTILFE